MGDIGNAYFNAETEEKIYICADPEFVAVVLMPGGTLLEVVKALYGFPI